MNLIKTNLYYFRKKNLFFSSTGTYIDRSRERLLHSYHNIVIRNTANSSINGILPYLGLYRTIYHVDGDELVPVDDCVPPSAINDFPGTVFPGEIGFFYIIAIFILFLLNVSFIIIIT